MVDINPWEILMQMVNFLILLWLMKKFLYKPLISFLDKREKEIEENIESAEQNKLNSEKLIEEQKEVLKATYKETKEIRKKAEEANIQEHQKIINTAKQEADNLLVKTKKQLELDVLKIKDEIKQDVGELAINLSEKLIETNLDKEKSKNIINTYLEKAKH